MFSKNRKSTIKKKITIFLALIFIVSIFITKIIVDNYFNKSFTSFVEEDMKELYFKGIKTLDDYYYFNNINEENISSGDLSRFPSFLSNRVNLNSLIFDSENNTLGIGIISEEIKLDELYELPENIHLVENNKTVVELEKGDKVVGKLIFAVYKEDSIIGKVIVIKDYTSYFNKDLNTKNLIIKIMVCMYFILFLGVYFIINRTTKPIALLKESLRKISDGNYDEINLTSNDEIGELITTFNFMSKKLKKKEEQEKLLFRNITHELKTPLTSISGYAQILKENPEEDFKLKSLDRIISESDRMHKLIVKILDISKQSSDLKQYAKEEIELLSLSKELIEKLNSKIKLKNLNFEINCLGESLKVYGNKYYIETLIENLMENAIKYSFENSKVEILIRSEREEYNIKFSIKNRGQRISESLKAHIFEPFTKGDTGAFANKTSTGLGLYICSNIVEMHKGEIFCETSGEISEFIFTLPKIN